MITKFKARMKENGQSFKWFWSKYIFAYGISYVQFIQQLNDFSPLKDEVKEEITAYMEK